MENFEQIEIKFIEISLKCFYCFENGSNLRKKL